MAADNLLRLSGYFGGEEGRGFRRRAAEQLAAAFAMPETPQAYPELTASLVTGILGPKQVMYMVFGEAGGEGALMCMCNAWSSYENRTQIHIGPASTYGLVDPFYAFGLSVVLLVDRHSEVR